MRRHRALPLSIAEGDRRERSHTEARIRQRRGVHRGDPARCRAVPRPRAHAHQGRALVVRQGADCAGPYGRLVVRPHVHRARARAGSALPRRPRRRLHADSVLRAARRESRRLFQAPALESPRRLVGGLPARLLELRLAREAQRRPPHVHERRRVRRRRHADSARPLHRGPAGAPLVPLPAVLHLAHVHAHGAEVADGRRSGRVRAREHRGEQAARPARLESRGPARGQGVLHRLGDRDPPPRLSVVGRRSPRTSASA